MRDRHVPRLCGSCQEPLSCQEETCWRCGARVRRAPASSRQGRSSRHARARVCPQRTRRSSAPRARRPGPRPVPDHTWADDFARRQQDRAEARVHSREVASELTAAIDAGDAGYRRLRRRLDEFGTRLDSVRATQCAPTLKH